MHGTELTECAPDKLIIGASRLLVRFMLRIKPFWRSSPEDEMTSSFLGGEPERALLTNVPSPGDGVPLFDIAERE